MKNQVQLIAYADRLGGTLRGLLELASRTAVEPLRRRASAAVLPADRRHRMRDSIPSITRRSMRGSARGTTCAPSRASSTSWPTSSSITSRAARRSSWISPRTGLRARYAGMFLTFDGVFPRGATRAGPARDLPAAAGLPFTPMTLADGSRANPLDHVHARADRHRRAAIREGSALSRRRSCETFAPNGVTHDPARRRRLRDQEGRTQLLHDAERPSSSSRGLLRSRKRTRARSARGDPLVLPPSKSRSRATSTGSTTSRCRRSCCTRFSTARPAP